MFHPPNRSKIVMKRTIHRTLRTVLLSAALTALAAGSAAAGEGWTEDWAAAKEQAAKQGKDLLIDFTGSDWCGWCIRLDKEVFSRDEFKRDVPKHFVLVKLDFPRRKSQPDTIKERNRELQRKYEVQGFPTILLADAGGNAYAKTGYRRGGAKPYVEHLTELRGLKAKRDKLLKQVAAAKGIEKAKALDRFIAYLSSADLPIDTKYYEQIVELDGEGKAGLKGKYEAKLALRQIQPKIAAAVRSGDYGKAMKVIDDALGKYKFGPEDKQGLLMQKAAMQYRQKRLDEAIALLIEARQAAPDTSTAERIPGIIRQLESQKAKPK